MRNLSTSLPGTSPPKTQRPESPERVLQAFKTAALSVTNLYKAAAQDHTKARSEGYHDALDDLLSFLDNEGLGLTDGEVRKVRTWAHERLDGKETAIPAQESDDDLEQTDRASSPSQQRDNSHTSAGTPSPTNVGPTPPTIPSPANQEAAQQAVTSFTPPSSDFSFSTPHIYPPQESEINIDGLNLSDRQFREPAVTSQSRSSTNSSNRSRNRHSAHAGRPASRALSNLRSVTGQKRKAFDFSEYWNLDDLGPHGNDGSGGSNKRGRFT